MAAAWWSYKSALAKRKDVVSKFSEAADLARRAVSVADEVPGLIDATRESLSSVRHGTWDKLPDPLQNLAKYSARINPVGATAQTGGALFHVGSLLAGRESPGETAGGFGSGLLSALAPAQYPMRYGTTPILGSISTNAKTSVDPETGQVRRETPTFGEAGSSLRSLLSRNPVESYRLSKEAGEQRLQTMPWAARAIVSTAIDPASYVGPKVAQNVALQAGLAPESKTFKVLSGLLNQGMDKGPLANTAGAIGTSLAANLGGNAAAEYGPDTPITPLVGGVAGALLLGGAAGAARNPRAVARTLSDSATRARVEFALHPELGGGEFRGPIRTGRLPDDKLAIVRDSRKFYQPTDITLKPLEGDQFGERMAALGPNGEHLAEIRPKAGGYDVDGRYAKDLDKAKDLVSARQAANKKYLGGVTPAVGDRVFFHGTGDFSYNLPDPEKAVGQSTASTRGPGWYLSADPTVSSSYGKRLFAAKFDGDVHDLTKVTDTTTSLLEDADGNVVPGGPTWTTIQDSLAEKMREAGYSSNAIKKIRTAFEPSKLGNALKNANASGAVVKDGLANGYVYHQALTQALLEANDQMGHIGVHDLKAARAELAELKDLRQGTDAKFSPALAKDYDSRIADLQQMIDQSVDHRAMLGKFEAMLDRLPPDDMATRQAIVQDTLARNNVDGLFHYSPRADGEVLIVLNSDAVRGLGELHNIPDDVLRNANSYGELVRASKDARSSINVDETGVWEDSGREAYYMMPDGNGAYTDLAAIARRDRNGTWGFRYDGQLFDGYDSLDEAKQAIETEVRNHRRQLGIENNTVAKVIPYGRNEAWRDVQLAKVDMLEQAHPGENFDDIRALLRSEYDAMQGKAGLPQNIQSADDLMALHDRLKLLMETGAKYRHWYQNSGEGLLQAYGGDKVQATRAAIIAAVGSANNNVTAQGGQILRGMAQDSLGQKLEKVGRFGSVDERAQQWLDLFNNDRESFVNHIIENINATGGAPKIGPFFTDLIDHIDPEMAATIRKYANPGATIDQWMTKVFGFDSKSITPAQRLFMQRETERLAKEAGWEPKQGQAALWVAQIAEEKGWDLQRAGVDYKTAINRAVAYMALETVPSADSVTAARLYGLLDSSPATLAEYHRLMTGIFLDEDGNDILARAMGLPVKSSYEAEGVERLVKGDAGYSGDGTPQVTIHPLQHTLLPATSASGSFGIVDPAVRTTISNFAALKTVILDQRAAPWMMPFDAEVPFRNGARLDIGDAPMSGALQRDIEGAINAIGTGTDTYVIVPHPRGAYIYTVPTETDMALRASMDSDIALLAAAKKQGNAAEVAAIEARIEATKAAALRLNQPRIATIKEAIKSVMGGKVKAATMAVDGDYPTRELGEELLHGSGMGGGLGASRVSANVRQVVDQLSRVARYAQDDFAATYGFGDAYPGKRYPGPDITDTAGHILQRAGQSGAGGGAELGSRLGALSPGDIVVDDAGKRWLVMEHSPGRATSTVSLKAEGGATTKTVKRGFVKPAHENLPVDPEAVAADFQDALSTPVPSSVPDVASLAGEQPLDKRLFYATDQSKNGRDLRAFPTRTERDAFVSERPDSREAHTADSPEVAQLRKAKGVRDVLNAGFAYTMKDESGSALPFFGAGELGAQAGARAGQAAGALVENLRGNQMGIPAGERASLELMSARKLGGLVKGLSNTTKSIAMFGDLGYSMSQGWGPLLNEGPRAWWDGMGEALHAWWTPDATQRSVREAFDTLMEAKVVDQPPSAGLPGMAEPYSISKQLREQGLKIGNAGDEVTSRLAQTGEDTGGTLSLAKRIERRDNAAFTSAGETWRMKVVNGMVDDQLKMNELAGIGRFLTDKQARNIADVANSAVLTSSKQSHPALNLLLLAPKMITAQVEMLRKSLPFINDADAARAYARQSIRRTAAYTAAATIALNFATSRGEDLWGPGLGWDGEGDKGADALKRLFTSPDKLEALIHSSNFMRVRTPGLGDVSLWGPLDAVIRQGLKQSANIATADPGQALEDITTFGRGKMAPVPGAAFDIFKGTDYRGAPVNLPQTLVRASVPWATGSAAVLLDAIVPWDLRSMRKLVGGDKDMAHAINDFLFGLRASPLSASEEALDEVATDPRFRVPNAKGVNEAPKSYYDLNKTQRALLAQEHPDLARKLIENASPSSKKYQAVLDGFTRDQELADQALLQGRLSPDQWRAQLNERKIRARQAAVDIFGESKSKEKATTTGDVYGNIIDRNIEPGIGINWDKVDAEVSRLTPDQQQWIAENRSPGNTALVQRYNAIAKVRAAYYDLPVYRGYSADEARAIDDAYNRARASTTTRDGSTPSDAQLLRSLAATSQGLDPRILSATRRRILGSLPKDTARERFRTQHPEMNLFYGRGTVAPEVAVSRFATLGKTG